MINIKWWLANWNICNW